MSISDLKWAQRNFPLPADERENNVLPSNSAHTSFCTVRFKHSSELTISKTHFWVEGDFQYHFLQVRVVIHLPSAAFVFSLKTVGHRWCLTATDWALEEEIMQSGDLFCKSFVREICCPTALFLNVHRLAQIMNVDTTSVTAVCDKTVTLLSTCVERLANWV